MSYAELIADGLCSCSTDAGGEIRATFNFPADSGIFAGHFPGRPILPGVGQLEAVRFVLERELGCSCRLRRAVSVKFFQPLLPKQEFTFAIRCRRDEPGRLNLRCLGTIGAGQIKCTEIKAEFSTDAATP